MNVLANPLWRRWTLAFTLGEIVGFVGIPVLGAMLTLALTGSLDTRSRAVVLDLVAILGGLGEGTVLGWFQARALKPLLPRLSTSRWVAATAGAAAFAWTCGMLAPTLDDLFTLSVTGQVAIWIPASILILISIGTAQAWVLRAHLASWRQWIVANILGWLAGLPWTFVLPALVPEGAAPWVWVATFLVAGTLMGCAAGAVTGVFLLRMLHRR
jgi:hypothetical protein